jgi:hypothetical protein
MNGIAWIIAAGLLVPTLAQGADKPPSPLVNALAACLDQRDDTRRLACLDVAATDLVAAERRRDVVVVDRDEVKRARRSLFGLGLGPADVFAGRDRPADRITQLDTTLAAAREVGAGRWSLTLAEGGRWQTTEAWTVVAALKPGTPVSVHPGALGSYVMRVRNQRTVRVQRVN